MSSAIRVKNDAAELEKLGTWLRAFAEEHGLFEADIHAVELVLEDALAGDQRCKERPEEVGPLVI